MKTEQMITEEFLTAIRNKKMKRKDISKLYRKAIITGHKPDYKIVNEAICERWSFSGLEYIKNLAWSNKII